MDLERMAVGAPGGGLVEATLARADRAVVDAREEELCRLSDRLPRRCAQRSPVQSDARVGAPGLRGRRRWEAAANLLPVALRPDERLEAAGAVAGRALARAAGTGVSLADASRFSHRRLPFGKGWGRGESWSGPARPAREGRISARG